MADRVKQVANHLRGSNRDTIAMNGHSNSTYSYLRNPDGNCLGFRAMVIMVGAASSWKLFPFSVNRFVGYRQRQSLIICYIHTYEFYRVSGYLTEPYMINHFLHKKLVIHHCSLSQDCSPRSNRSRVWYSIIMRDKPWRVRFRGQRKGNPFFPVTRGRSNYPSSRTEGYRGRVTNRFHLVYNHHGTHSEKLLIY